MSLLLDEIYVDGIKVTGHVIVSFGNIDLDFDVASARKVAAVLLDQADVAELEAMQVAP
jgi:hypothetical protein